MCEHSVNGTMGVSVGEDHMTDWIAPNPGPWQQDSAHMPAAMTALMQDVFAEGFNRGFTETFARYGMLLDRLALGVVNGFTYHQPQPFDMPGPDGPMSPDEIGAEIGRREALAHETFATKRWRSDLLLWDDDCKPTAIARHRELGGVDLSALDGPGLDAHVSEAVAHVGAMTYQHHRFNMAAMMPVGDLALHVAAWTGMPPPAALALLEGYSSISAVSSDESASAVAAIAANPEATELVRADGDAAQRLARLRELLPAVDDYVTMVQDRTLDGFDIVNPTLREHPELMLGKFALALDGSGHDARATADALADEYRAQVPPDEQAAFDELLAEARTVYRLRDERGLYSDITAFGILRRAVLEVGRRAVADGRLEQAELALDASLDELRDLIAGAGPTTDELAARRDDRLRRTAEGAPRYLGPPPPPPPPVDQLPPSLGRMMGAVGFMIDGILGQLDQSTGTENSIVGIGITGHSAEGRARLIHTLDDLLEIEPGDIVVAKATGESFNSVLHLVGGIVTDHGSHACHAAIVAREMGFPAVVGTVDGSTRIPDGARVRVDGPTGEVTVLA